MLNDTLLTVAAVKPLSPGAAISGNGSPDNPAGDPTAAKATEFSSLVQAKRTDDQPQAETKNISANRNVNSQNYSALNVRPSGRQLNLPQSLSDSDHPIPETDDAADPASSAPQVTNLRRLLVSPAAIQAGDETNSGSTPHNSLLETRTDIIVRSIPDFSSPIEADPKRNASPERQEGGPLSEVYNRLFPESAEPLSFGARPPVLPRQQFSTTLSLSASGKEPSQAPSQADSSPSALPNTLSAATSTDSTPPGSTFAEGVVSDEISRSGPLISGVIDGRSSLLGIKASIGQGVRLAAASPADPPQPFRITLFAKANEKEFELRLDPPDLGSVTLVFFEDDAGMQRATITSDRSDTLDLLRRHSDVLQRELSRAGAGDVEFGFHQSKHDRRDDRPIDLTGARGGIAPLSLVLSAEPLALTAEPGRIDRFA